MASVSFNLQRAKETSGTKIMKKRFGILCLSVFLIAASCSTLPEDRGSAFARAAGQSTVAIGASCSKPMQMGYIGCQLERGKSLPTLTIIMTNPGEWAISDCGLNLWKSGTMTNPGFVEVDLSGLNESANKFGFCMLKIETVERWPDNKDKKQFHQIPISGGFFIEMLEPGYYPKPPAPVVAWCYVLGRTTKGRTMMKRVSQDYCQ